jgi:uncharacterized protein YbjT (DUF2867 family)
MILVTGAAGKTGQAVIKALVTDGESVRALVHRPEQVQLIEALGAQEVLVGDMLARVTVDRAVQGIRAVYHICPNVSPDEVAIGHSLIKASRSSGVEHFVYHSVLHPQTEEMPHHWMKMRVEEQLLKSGLPFTILQPTAYMQNILTHWHNINENGVYPIPYAAETRLSMVDLNDVAQAAVIVLGEPEHFGATYELVGTTGMTQTAVAEILSLDLERTVSVEVVPIEKWVAQARSSGLGEYQIETLTKMFAYYDHHGLWGSPRVLTWLLDRSPTSFTDFLERAVQERRIEQLEQTIS